jgi:hypothetical protein
MGAVMQENYAALYRPLHAKNHRTFAGRSIRVAVPFITALVQRTKPRRLLDYGCGKGIQYSELRVHEQWGGLMPRLYDVGMPQFSADPPAIYDGVICTDVMEHIAEADVPAILKHLFSKLPPRNDGGQSFALFWIACRPAKRKTLRDGRNVHLTIKSPEWWDAQIEAKRPAHVLVEAHYDLEDDA